MTRPRHGHFHHRPGRRHAAGRPRRRGDQGRDAGHRRSVPRLQGRPLFAALPDLQPQQEDRSSSTPRSRPTSPRSTSWSKTADVFIQNFRPAWPSGSASAPSGCRRSTRGSIYCWHLRLRQRRAAARTGRRSTPSPRRPPGSCGCWSIPANPRVVGPAIGDAITGFYAAYGVLGALYERETTGKGRLVETSMFEAMSHFNLDDFTHYLSDGEVMGPYVAAARLAILRVPMRRRRLDRAAHVEPAQVLGEPRRGGRPAGHAAAARVREPPGADRQLREGGRIPRPDLRAAAARRTGRSGWPRSKCRIRRSIPRRKWSRASWRRTTGW